MKRQGLLVVAAIGVLSACEGALTAHVDTAAKAGSQELTIERLGQLLGNSQIPLQGPQVREVARSIANVWVDYQLLGVAASKGDSLTDQKSFDEGMWAIIGLERIRKLGAKVLENTPAWDSAGIAQRYATGDVLAARHILLAFPGTNPQQPDAPPVPQAVKDSVRRKIEALRAQVTPSNFAQLAQKNSADQASAARGGDLGLFPKGQMVPAFSNAVAALQPGQISGPVETQYGYHIIYRPTYAEVAQQYRQADSMRVKMVAESTYLKNLETKNKVEVKSDAALWAKSIAQDVDGHLKDSKVLATSSIGDLTAGRVAQWIASLPQAPQIRAQLTQIPDTQIRAFIGSIARNEILLKQADSAKIQLDTAELNNLHRAFTGAVTNAWAGLSIRPSELTDSAKGAGDKEKVAAARVESYLTRLTQQQAQFVEVPVPVERALRSKYEYKLNDAAFDRALERAAQVRATRDSSKAAGQPATAVPLPGGAGAPPAAPTPAAPTPAAPPKP